MVVTCSGCIGEFIFCLIVHAWMWYSYMLSKGSVVFVLLPCECRYFCECRYLCIVIDLLCFLFCCCSGPFGSFWTLGRGDRQVIQYILTRLLLCFCPTCLWFWSVKGTTISGQSARKQFWKRARFIGPFAAAKVSDNLPQIHCRGLRREDFSKQSSLVLRWAHHCQGIWPQPSTAGLRDKSFQHLW